MRRLPTSAATAVLLIALGALAFFALPSAETAASNLAAPNAPDATERWNNIALPLEVDGVTTADEVAGYINSNTNPPAAADSIRKVAKWEEDTQAFVIRNYGSPLGQPDFAVQTGDWLFVAANANSPDPFTFAWVGDVPAAGSQSYAIVANGWSDIMLPLDTNTSTVDTADALAADIGDVSRVAKWDADSQAFVIRSPSSPLGQPDFPVEIGYPYFIYATSAKTWP